ncbi:penicillin acylase family protein [Halobacillus karajensis]|uniref:Penicillin acylase 2 n=1 Tax=Halobacillus karajensis TaxID=195088 RepID=A0A024P2V4_9BACI|nr:penicillin acylase family protein [Halobacillus karajensis]CDQ19995.1 Penicillin acylase 2 precursor [Halobacillus karajensis]CDQ22455.1 Penicillin acylase 2 precursor [Halobacillus karajensis]CDQ28298.1 Penicillin acylase 2 precursor [Halobacillus karajensis]
METAKRLDQGKRSKPRWKKVVWWMGGIVVFLLASASLFVNVYTSRSLPQVEGETQLTGLQAQVNVTRDEQGVPHIQAENELDLFRAQGYVQAQDRLFQMELARRQASGRISEVVGEVTVDQDRYFRTLGLRRAAEKSLAIYSDEAVARLQAFADGVNTFIEKEALPPEFAMMGIDPEPWTPLDSLTIGKYMAFDLGGHWERQAFNYFLLQNFSEEEAYELFPTYPDEAPTVLADHEPVDIEKNLTHAVIPNEFNGSNNWVVSGERTASGKPMLADDPHLSMATPSIWYQMHLDAPGYNVSGVIFAGIPGIILGHNEDIAWGVTNVGPDVQQLYLEKRNPQNPKQFLYEGEWEEAEVWTETIEVKGGSTEEIEVVETRHGPIISDFAAEPGNDTLLSLCWTALEATKELEAVLEMNRASDWASFEKGLENFLVPAQNFVFASKDGTIAYKANGQIPIYNDPDDALLPQKGWEAEDEWQGFIPFEELPMTINPDEGAIATANNKITSEDYPYHISHNWAQPYRYQRITEMLEGKDELRPEDFQTMQMDVKNLQAEEFLPLLMKNTKVVTNLEKEVIRLLDNWNREDDRDLAQPLVFHRWMAKIEEELYNVDLPASMQAFFTGSGQTTDELLRMGEESRWIQKAGGLEVVISEAFQKMLAELTEEYGKDPSKWKWGEAHAVEFTHPLSSIGFLERFLNPGDPYPVSGSRVTVRAAGFNRQGLVNHGASWRFVIDMTDTNEAYHVVGPGQSGHFRSDWYHDQLTSWVEGDYHLTKTEEYTGDVLTLSP